MLECLNAGMLECSTPHKALWARLDALHSSIPAFQHSPGVSDSLSAT